MHIPLHFRLALLFCFAFSYYGFGQPYVDLLTVKAEYFPGHMDAGENKDSLSTHHYEAGFFLPLERKNKDVILLGGNYSQLNFHYTGTPAGDARLYSVLLAGGYEMQWKNPKWKTMLLGLPKVNSDMKSGTTDAFQMGAYLQFTLQKSDSLKYHFGLYYNQELFGDYFLPLVGIDWKINGKFHLFGDLPNTMNLEYKMFRSLYVGFAYNSVIGTYRLENGNYVREGLNFWGYEQYKVYLNGYLTRHIVWFGEFGHTYGRVYKLYNQADEELNPLPVYGQNLDGWMFNTGLAYRFRLDEK